MNQKVATSPDAARQAAVEQLVAATIALQKLDDKLTAEIPRRHRSRPTADQLSADELVTLQYHVWYQSARALRQQALCHEAASADQIGAITQALATLQKPLAQLSGEDPLVADLYFEQALCYRLRRDFTAAAKKLSAVATHPSSARHHDAVQAEGLRLRLAQGKVEEAIEHWRDTATATDTDPQLSLAKVETCVAATAVARQDNDEQEATLWQKRALALIRQTERTHGAYWGRRAELLLISATGNATANGDWEVLARSADHLYRQKEWDQAVATYDKAAAAAASAGDSAKAFTLAYKAALVEHGRERKQTAADRFAKLARRWPKHAKADAAHLNAIILTARLVQSASEPEAPLARYQQLLRDHLATWPTSASSQKCGAWLGKLCEQQKHSDEAMAAYRSAIMMGSDDVPETWNDLQRQSVVDFARIGLSQSAGTNDDELIRLLTAALSHTTGTSAAWQSHAATLLFAAHARQPSPDVTAASQLASQLRAATVDQLQHALTAISPNTSSESNTVRSERVKLTRQLTSTLLAKQSELTDAQRLHVQWRDAELLATAGDHAKAVKQLEALAVDHKDNGPLQVAYAQMLLASRDAASLQKALATWRVIASRSKPKSKRWYDAKYSIALAQYKTGKPGDAAKLIRYLQATAGLDSSERKDEFLSLLRRCE